MAGRILDKTITSFEEATGKLEDAIGWVEKAKEYDQETLRSVWTEYAALWEDDYDVATMRRT